MLVFWKVVLRNQEEEQPGPRWPAGDVHPGGLRKVAEHVCVSRSARGAPTATLSPVQALCHARLRCRPGR